MPRIILIFGQPIFASGNTLPPHQTMMRAKYEVARTIGHRVSGRHCFPCLSDSSRPTAVHHHCLMLRILFNQGGSGLRHCRSARGQTLERKRHIILHKKAQNLHGCAGLETRRAVDICFASPPYNTPNNVMSGMTPKTTKTDENKSSPFICTICQRLGLQERDHSIQSTSHSVNGMHCLSLVGTM